MLSDLNAVDCFRRPEPVSLTAEAVPPTLCAQQSPYAWGRKG